MTSASVQPRDGWLWILDALAELGRSEIERSRRVAQLLDSSSSRVPDQSSLQQGNNEQPKAEREARDDRNE